MGVNNRNTILYTLGLLFVLFLAVHPVMAINGTISIAYRGAGGSYLGDTVIFDGYNSFSNVTLLRMTGPGLPAEGVPVYDMNGKTGSGNTIPVNSDSSWRFAWYTGTIKGLEKLQTARYYITAFDMENPEKTATTSVLLKKPEFYVIATPATAGFGEYIQLTGVSEKINSNVHFDITDPAGKVVHAYDSTVSSSGYFNKGFHVDMPPGVYTITMSSPSGKTTYRNYLTVNQPATPAVPAVPTPVPDLTATPEPVNPSPSPSAMVIPAGTGSLFVTSTPSGAPVFLDSVLAGSTPLRLNSTAPGNHLVEIKNPGYISYSVQVIVKPGETTSINPTLLKGSSPVPVSTLTVISGVLIALAVMISCTKRRRP